MSRVFSLARVLSNGVRGARFVTASPQAPRLVVSVVSSSSRKFSADSHHGGGHGKVEVHAFRINENSRALSSFALNVIMR